MATGTSSTDASPTVRKRRPYRRAEILRAAVRLFHQRGYAETSMEDIGEAVGLAGPSIYRHFASKYEILETALGDVNTAFWADYDKVIASVGEPTRRLDSLISTYVRWLFEDPAITAVSVQLRRHLSESAREAANKIDRQLVATWVDAVVEVRPELDRSAAKLLVRGALDIALAMAGARTSLSRAKAMELTERATLAALMA